MSAADHAEDDAARKRIDALRAEAAAAGFGLYALSSGGWLLTRWGYSREVPDTAAVAELLRQMTGREQ